MHWKLHRSNPQSQDYSVNLRRSCPADLLTPENPPPPSQRDDLSNANIGGVTESQTLHGMINGSALWIENAGLGCHKYSYLHFFLGFLLCTKLSLKKKNKTGIPAEEKKKPPPSRFSLAKLIQLRCQQLPSTGKW